MNDETDDWRSVLAAPVDVDPFRSLSSEILLEIGAASKCGTEHSYNTDHYLALRVGRLQETLATSLAEQDLPPRFEEYAYVLLIADGLGGSAGGGRASRVALSALAHQAIRYGKWNVRLEPDTAARIDEQGEFFFRQINDAVLEASRAHVRLADMATSLTVVYIAETSLFFAHVGHARAFLFRDGVLIQLTEDQTLEQRRPGTRQLHVLQQPKVDMKHVVTETLGSRPGGPEVVIEHVELWSGDRVVLCTNGLTDVLRDDQIADVLAFRRRPDDDCQRLVDLALAAGGRDDVTVLIADYRTTTPFTRTEVHA